MFCKYSVQTRSIDTIKFNLEIENRRWDDNTQEYTGLAMVRLSPEIVLIKFLIFFWPFFQLLEYFLIYC